MHNETATMREIVAITRETNRLRVQVEAQDRRIDSLIAAFLRGGTGGDRTDPRPPSRRRGSRARVQSRSY